MFQNTISVKLPLPKPRNFYLLSECVANLEVRNMLFEGAENGEVPSSGAGGSMILCCMCGCSITPNPANMCTACITTRVDISAGISRNCSVTYCKGCGRYEKPPWLVAELESPQLLAICLGNVKGLKTVHLVDATWIWTEPHSRRLKIKLTVRKEAFDHVVLEQTIVIEFVVNTRQCEDCTRAATEHTWKTVVQVRQKVPHQRTFLYLEQLLIKHGLHENVQRVVQMPHGLDFFYGTNGRASQLTNFLQAVVPVRLKTSKRLISQDFTNNVCNYKFTIFVEVVPVVKGDLVFLSKSLRKHMGGVRGLMLCHRVTNIVQLVDTEDPQRGIFELNPSTCWQHGLRSVATVLDLVSFIVLDIEYESNDEKFVTKGKRRRGPAKDTFGEATVTVMRESDLGVTDGKILITTSHLGHILKVGDNVGGYDLTASSVAELGEEGVPEVILVKKLYPARKGKRTRKRKFKLKHMEMEKELLNGQGDKENDDAKDMEMFLCDIEEDPELRNLIDLYQNLTVSKPGDFESEAEEDDDFPEIQLDELLNDMKL